MSTIPVQLLLLLPYDAPLRHYDGHPGQPEDDREPRAGHGRLDQGVGAASLVLEIIDISWYYIEEESVNELCSQEALTIMIEKSNYTYSSYAIKNKVLSKTEDFLQ